MNTPQKQSSHNIGEKMTQKIYNETPACKCGGYHEIGDSITIIPGIQDGYPHAWIACPSCGAALGGVR